MAALERRASVTLECRAQENKLVGIAAAYETLSGEIYGFREKIQRGAFDKSLKENSILALYSHDDRLVLGRTSSGTLKLRSTEAGLEYEIDLPDTDYANNLRELVRRGDVNQCSFGFYCPPGGDKWDRTNKPFIRTLIEVDLREISIVADPAYPQGTSAQLRDLRSVYLHHMRSHAKRWLAVEKLRFPQRRQHGS